MDNNDANKRLSNQKMLLMTQIAYLDIPFSVENVLAILKSEDTFTLRKCLTEWNKLLCLDTTNAIPYKEKQRNVISDIYVMLNNMKSLQPLIFGFGTEDCAIIDVLDNTTVNGFYACAVDFGDGSLYIGFRGSESYDIRQVVEDWIGADVSLVGNIETEQQSVAMKYLEYIHSKYGDKYESYYISGHSLGGNLAMHVEMTEDKEIAEKIGWITNLDGPGVSQNYIDHHKTMIPGKIEHIAYSWVSCMLSKFPEIEHTIAQAINEEGGEDVRSFLYRHATHNLVYKNQELIKKEYSPKRELDIPLAKIMRAISNSADRAVLSIKEHITSMQKALIAEGIKEKCLPMISIATILLLKGALKIDVASKTLNEVKTGLINFVELNEDKERRRLKAIETAEWLKKKIIKDFKCDNTAEFMSEIKDIVRGKLSEEEVLLGLIKIYDKNASVSVEEIKTEELRKALKTYRDMHFKKQVEMGCR